MLCNLDFISRDSVFFDPSDLKSAGAKIYIGFTVMVLSGKGFEGFPRIYIG